MFKYFLLAAITIHLVIFIPAFGGREELKVTKPQACTPSVNVKVLPKQEDESPAGGTVRGFPPKGEAPADTYVPDGTCAWSMELQKQLQDNPDWYYGED